MLRDKPFEFNNNNTAGKQDLIENEIVLNFYALRLFIQICDDLVSLSDCSNLEQSKIQVALISLKSKLELVSKCLIDSFDLILDQTIQTVLIDKKQNFYNMKEKLEFFKIKIDSFVIAIDNSLIQNDMSTLVIQLKRLSVVIIEAFVRVYLLISKPCI